MEAEDRNHRLDVISARQVKHDCRYPGAVPLQIRWTAVDVVEPRRSCCDWPTRYEWNHCRTGPVQNNLTRKHNYESKTVDDLTMTLVPIETWRKINTNFEQKIKTTQKLKILMRKKFKVGIEKINYDAVETSWKNLTVSRKTLTRSTSDSNVDWAMIADLLVIVSIDYHLLVSIFILVFKPAI